VTVTKFDWYSIDYVESSIRFLELKFYMFLHDFYVGSFYCALLFIVIYNYMILEVSNTGFCWPDILPN